MTIFVTWQLIVTLDSIRNSCDVLFSFPFQDCKYSKSLLWLRLKSAPGNPKRPIFNSKQCQAGKTNVLKGLSLQTKSKYDAFISPCRFFNFKLEVSWFFWGNVLETFQMFEPPSARVRGREGQCERNEQLQRYRKWEPCKTGWIRLWRALAMWVLRR